MFFIVDSVFRPFAALRYDDPSSPDVEGVLDLDAVIAPYGHHETELETWAAKGKLRRDTRESLYLYRGGHYDATGAPAQVSAVFGLLGGLDRSSTFAAVTPHLVPVSAVGFEGLLMPMGMPLARATEENGSHHRLWEITQPAVVEMILDAVDAAGTMPPGQGLALAFDSTATEPRPALGLLFASPHPANDDYH